MYESNPATVASLLQPITSLISRPGLLNPILGASTEIYLDTAGFPLVPLHKNDRQPIRVVAETGSISGNSQPMILPKQSQFIAGKDISNLRADIKNLNVGDLTSFQAGRDIVFDIKQDESSNKLLTNIDRIRVGGPGLLGTGRPQPRSGQ